MFRAVRATAQRISTLTVASVVALSSLTVLAPLFVSSNATAAPGVTTTNTGFNALTDWQDDRSAPSGGYTHDVAQLVLHVDGDSPTALAANAFHRTEGVSAALPAGTNSIKATLHVDEAWENKIGVRAGLWGVTATTPSVYPILEFSNRDDANDQVAGTPQIRAWDSATGWTTLVSNPTYGASYTFEIVHNPYTNTFEFYVGNSITPAHTVSTTFGGSNHGPFGRVIFNSYNSAIAANDYTVRWSNFETGVRAPDVPVLSAPINGAAFKTSQLPITQSWTTVPGAIKYKYESYASNPETGPATPTHSQTTTTNGRVIGNTAAEGKYWWRVKAVTPHGDSAWSAVRTFSVDNTAPTITIKSDAVGTHPTYSRVSFKLSDPGANGKLREVVLNGHSYARNTQINDLNWGNIQKSHLIEGENVVYAVDASGNKSDELTFTYDKTAPTGTLAYSHNNNITNQDVTVTLTTSEPVQTPADWNKTNDTTFTKLFTDNQKFNVTVADLAGNTSIVKGEVKRIDHVDPVFVNVIDGGVYNTNIQVVAHDQSLTDKLDVNGSLVQLENTPGTWDWTAVTPLSSDGVYALIASDKAGNSTTITITIDTVVPTVPVITSPVDGTEFDSSVREIVATWDASTDATSGVKGYEIEYSYVRNGAVVTDYRYTTDTSRAQQLSGNVLSDFTIRVRADDKAGNWSDWSAPVMYYYGTGNPGGGQGSGDNSDDGDDFVVATPPTGDEAGFVASRAVTNDGSRRVLAANTTSQAGGTVMAAETTNSDNAVDGAVDEDDDKLVEDAGSVFDYWWIVLLALIGLFWLFAAKRRKNEK